MSNDDNRCFICGSKDYIDSYSVPLPTIRGIERKYIDYCSVKCRIELLEFKDIFLTRYPEIIELDIPE